MTPSPMVPDDGHPPEPPGPVSALHTPSSTAEVTALAAQLRRLADHIDHLDAECADLSGALTGHVLPQLIDVHSHIAEHTTQLKQLTDHTDAPACGPIDWTTMDADRAATEWDALARWIEHSFVPWHEISRDQLPDCWALHRPAVIELAWLHHTHQAAYEPSAPPHLAPEWHTRWKPAALRTIHDAIPRHGIRICGPGQHLISETERVRLHPTITPPQTFPIQPAPAPTTQLAERHHWQHFYKQAVSVDLLQRVSTPRPHA